MNIKKNNILIIDSGIGGLFILNKIRHLIPKNINYIYIMDNKGFPYGNKNYLYIIKRIISIITFILKKYKIIMLIIACNTASIISNKYLKKKFCFPIIKITPNINLSCKKTKNNIVGLLATFITINNNSIKNKIKKLTKKIKILKKHSFKLIKESENKIKKNKINQKNINNILKNWKLFNKYPDTIILGCTHFCFLKKEIQKALKKKICFIEYNKKIHKKISKNINKYKKKKSKKRKNIFLYTKKKNLKKYFIKLLIKKYKFNIIKKIDV